MSNLTPKLGLKQPLGTESADISIINENMRLLDTILPMILSGGYKIQSGTLSVSTIANSAGTTTVTFPVEFSGVPLVFVSYSSGFGDNQTVVIGASSATATRFILNYLLNTTGAISVTWVAIGS